MLCIIANGCATRVELDDSCFPIDPWKDERDAAREYRDSEDFLPSEWDRMLTNIGFCEYEGAGLNNILPGNTRAEIDLVVSCQYSDVCEQCVDDSIDAQILETYRWYQDRFECPADEREVLAYTRGCVSEEEDDEGNALCCYSGAFVSECRVGLLTTEGARPVETPAVVRWFPG